MARVERHPSLEVRLLGAAGELDSREQQAFDRHVEQCPTCRLAIGEDARLIEAAGGAYARSEADTAASAAVARAHLIAAMGERGHDVERSLDVGRLIGALTPGRVFALGVAAALLLVATLPAIRTMSNVPSDRAHAIAEWLPDVRHTPGAVVPVSVEALCAGAHPAPPPISAELRADVLHRYGMIEVAEHEYELDYLITPELGGATDAANLWPERYVGSPWNALVKDHLERLLPRKVCAGEIPLARAQQDIAQNWIAAYKKYFETNEPLMHYALLNTPSHLPRLR